jgi:hypothetical protein
MKFLNSFKMVCEYLGGSLDELPAGLPPDLASVLSSGWFRGLWWGVIAGLILLFCGQTSKFIYIDF